MGGSALFLSPISLSFLFWVQLLQGRTGSDVVFSDPKSLMWKFSFPCSGSHIQILLRADGIYFLRSCFASIQLLFSLKSPWPRADISPDGPCQQFHLAHAYRRESVAPIVLQLYDCLPGAKTSFCLSILHCSPTALCCKRHQQTFHFWNYPDIGYIKLSQELSPHA